MNNVKENKLLKEKLIVHELKSGLTCFFINKKGYKEKQAMICTKYGSLDNSFTIGGKKHEMPVGIAHFLEHKLFEEENGNTFEEFITNGADCNAFTNFTTTAYHFNCIDNFEKNLETLLKFTSSAYLTDENVEKEKGIITQEINMYDDDADWIVFFNMVRGLYKKHPARENIAGTEESINKITKEMLYDCYNTFYNPQNMALVICGDVDFDKSIDLAEQYVKKADQFNVERDIMKEPKKVYKSYIEQKMSVAMPLFNIGFKENNDDAKNIESVSTKILLDMLCGESSTLYNRLYNEGLIDKAFYSDYIGNKFFGTSIIGGISNNPKKVAEYVISEINSLKQKNICSETFERLKKKHIGKFVRGFNSIDNIASSQIDCFAKDTDIIEVFESYMDVNIDDIAERLHEHFNEDYMTLSVINS